MDYKLNLQMGLEEKLKSAPLDETTIGTISFAVDSKCLFIDALNPSKNRERLSVYAHGLTQQDGTLLDTSKFMLNNNPKGTGAFSLNRKEGSNIGVNSFTEGTDNIASGTNSHAGGANTIVTGLNGFGFGEGIKVTLANQTVFGKYNDLNDRALFAVGTGTNDSNRQNSFSIHKDEALFNVRSIQAPEAVLDVDAIRSTNWVTANELHSNVLDTEIIATDTIQSNSGTFNRIETSAMNVSVVNASIVTVQGAPVATQEYVNNEIADFVTESEVNDIIEANTSITGNIQSQIDSYIPFIESPTEPSDKKKIWIDNSTTIPTMKYYSTSKNAWTKLGAHWG